MTHSAWKPPAAEFVPAEVLAGYAQLTQIGRGGDSVVYRAREISLNRDVAIKVLLVDDEERASRFTREVQITVELGRAHPNIVNVLAVGTTVSGRPAIVMDYYEQGTLHDRLKAHGPFPVEEVVTIGSVLADALAFAHGRGVLHRDVKPQNVLVLPTSWVLADFGVARLIDAEHTASAETFTYRHAAPQVLDGLPPSASDDIWSLGSTLYTLLDGRPPFASNDPGDDTALAYLRRARTEPHRRLTQPDQVGIAKVIDRCLVKGVADRWASAAELRQALESLRSHAWEPTAPRTSVQPAPADRLPPPPEPSTEALAWAPREQPATPATTPTPVAPPTPPPTTPPADPAPIAISALGFEHGAAEPNLVGPDSSAQVDAEPTARAAAAAGARPPAGSSPGLSDQPLGTPRTGGGGKRTRTLWVWGGVALVIGLGLGIGRVLLSTGQDTPSADEPTAGPSSPQTVPTLTGEPEQTAQPRRADPKLAFDFLKLDSDGTTLELKWTDPSDGLGTFVLTQLGKEQKPVYQFPAGTTTGSLPYALKPGRTCFLLSVVMPDRSLGQGAPVRCLNR
jgi:serine/threonine protein kinase